MQQDAVAFVDILFQALHHVAPTAAASPSVPANSAGVNDTGLLPATLGGVGGSATAGLTAAAEGGGGGGGEGGGEGGGGGSWIDALFGVELEMTLQCEECAAEPRVSEPAPATCRVLDCAVTAAAAHRCIDGVVHSLEQPSDYTIRRWSAALGREANWRVVAERASRLPPYLCIAIRRFTQKSVTARESGALVTRTRPCKLKKNVALDEVIDASAIATPALAGELRRRRDLARRAAEAAAAVDAGATVEGADAARSSSEGVDGASPAQHLGNYGARQALVDAVLVSESIRRGPHHVASPRVT